MCNLVGVLVEPLRESLAMTRDEVIRIMCPNLGCQRVLAVPGSARGKLVRCRGCGSNIRIPTPRLDAAVTPPPAEKTKGREAA